MFQTLKAQNGVLGDTAFVVRSSIPASDVVKPARKPACTRCKMKKLKCIVDRNTCDKCEERGLICSYNNASHDRNASTATTQDAPTNQRDLLPASSSILAQNTNTESDPRDTDRSSADSTSDPIIISPVDDDLDAYLSMTPNLDGHCPSFLQSTSSSALSMSDPASWSSGPASTVASRDSGYIPDVPLSNNDEIGSFDVCFCVELVISANAVMQVKLVWAHLQNSCSSSSIDDMLQCQKNILASCDTLLACKKCSAKSCYVVLVISMCREMVCGINKLQIVVSMEPITLKRPHPDCEAPGNPQLGAGAWRLDDEDEIEIIRHLIQVRRVKLKKLVDQLEKVVTANHVSYLPMVQNLRNGLDSNQNS